MSKFIKSYLVLFVFLSGFSSAYAEWRVNDLIAEYELAQTSELVSTAVLPVSRDIGAVYIVNTYKNKALDHNIIWRCVSRFDNTSTIYDSCQYLADDYRD